MRTPELALVSAKNTATTYSFQTTGEGFKSWALCTVNDVTGELNIQSDFGNWSHRWNTDALGSPTLTAFIGDRSDVDYLASKLQSQRGGGNRWSAGATARALWPEDKALRNIVLPALITACRARVEAPPPRSLSWTIQHVVAYLRSEAASFDDAVAMEERELTTHYAAVKRRAVQAMADRIEAGAWIPPKAAP